MTAMSSPRIEVVCGGMETHAAELCRLARAGARVVQIVSHEWARAQGAAIGLAADLGVPLETWAASTGLVRWDADTDQFRRCSPAHEGDLVAVLQAFHSRREPCVLLLEDCHPFLEGGSRANVETIRWVREMCRLDASPRKILLLATPVGGLPVELEKEVPSIEIPLPGKPELRNVCRQVAAEQGCPLDGPEEKLLDAARGLTVMEAALAYGKAALQLGRLDARAIPIIVEEKERIIRQSGALEFYRPDVDLGAVGGLDLLKEWLRKRQKAFGTAAREFGLDAPRGILLLGVQGCGKSLVAKAVAREWGFPLLRLDMGRVFGGLVGQSEANIRSATKVAGALAPCVLWIDEIEKGAAGLGSSDTSDAGTTARVMGTFLTWMQERKEPVFVLATANRIAGLPPELLRKGRFDDLFFVDLPDATTREEILGIHLRRRRRDVGRFDLRALADASAGFSGAELEEAVREGLFDAFDAGRELESADLLRALRATVPLSCTMKEEIEALREWASRRARPASRSEVVRKGAKA